MEQLRSHSLLQGAANVLSRHKGEGIYPAQDRTVLQGEVEAAMLQALRDRYQSIDAAPSLPPTPPPSEETTAPPSAAAAAAPPPPSEAAAAPEAAQPAATLPAGSVLRFLLSATPLVTDGVAAIVDDSFLAAFAPADTSAAVEWLSSTWYLRCLWLLGVLLRYLFLLPLRIAIVAAGYALIYPPFFALKHGAPQTPGVLRVQQALVTAMCRVWLTAWAAAVRYRGPRPSFTPGHVWVANHTSMIDFHILAAHHPFACLMQQHVGALGWVQRHVWSTIGCINFDRQGADRHQVAARMKAHITTPGAAPLLVFPEGVCTNNTRCLLFKRGAFDLGATVCPIAIKYHTTFSDPFWARGETFIWYQLRLLSSWAVVATVTFLPPQQRRPGESIEAFASRVQGLIADKAGLQVQPWDGMLKHYALGPRRPHLLALRQGLIADMATPYLGHAPRGPGAADAAAALAAAAAQLAASSRSSSGSGEGGGTSAGGGVDASRLHAEAATAITQGSRFQWDWGQLVNTRPPPPATAASAGKKEA